MTLFGSVDQEIILYFSQILDSAPLLRLIVIAFALAGVYIIPVVWVIYWFKQASQRESLLSSILAGVIAWVGINNLIQLFYFQNRPVHELPVREWLFERPENSFPSDHIAFLSGITIFFFLQKKYRSGSLLLLLTIIVGITRVGVAVHYPSDIIFGFLTGAVVGLAVYLIHPWLSRSIWPHVVSIARRLKLG